MGQSQHLSDQVLQRLSSGLRINSAKDDAAGLAISTRFQAQIGGLDVAMRNANDGISLVQTAEAALGEVTHGLQRVRELALQSVNATNSDADRQALQEEVGQLMSEIDRIAVTTAFNGTELLDGSFTHQLFQVGANTSQTVDVSISGARIVQIGRMVEATGMFSNEDVVSVGTSKNAEVSADSYIGVNSEIIDGTNVTVNGVNIASSSVFTGQSARGQTADSAYAKARALNASGAGISAIATNTQRIALGGASAIELTNGDGPGDGQIGDRVNYSLSVNGAQVFAAEVFKNRPVTASAIVEAINSKTGTTGVSATLDAVTDELVLTNVSGGNIRLDESAFAIDGGDHGNNIKVDTLVAQGTNVLFDGTEGFNSATYRGNLTIRSPSQVNTTAGANIIGLDADTQAVLEVNADTSTASVDISSAENASRAIFVLDAALDAISSSRASLGAVQNRFESAISTIASSLENLAAANSRILDADFAVESAKFSKVQVLRQAGIAVLAQANARPQQILSLLQ